MKRFEDMSTETGERRRNRRATNRGSIKLKIDTQELEGHADNVSPTGVLFFSEGDLRVTVEVEENGATKTHARAAWSARSACAAIEFRWAVEFDA